MGFLHIDNLAWAVRCYWGGSPNVTRRIVVGADTCIVSTRATASDQSTVEVGECGHRLQDGALGASIVAFQKVERSATRGNGQITLKS
jgi:hypothetical protein